MSPRVFEKPYLPSLPRLLEGNQFQVIGGAAFVDIWPGRPMLITISDELNGRFLKVAGA
jgi:hypothetical protein